MANLATVTIQFQSQGGQQVAKQTNEILSLMKQLAGQFGVATTLADLAANAIIGMSNSFSNMVKSGVESYKTFEVNIRALAIYQTSVESTAAQLQRLREISQSPGLSLEEVSKGVLYLEAAGFNARLSERAIAAFGNALALAGKGAEDLAGVQLALGQIKSKGIISAEEINQIAERVPQVRRAIQEVYKTANTQELQKMKIPATEFITRIVERLELLKKAPMTIAAVVKNFNDTFKYSSAIIGRGMVDMGQGGEGLKLLTDSMYTIKTIAIEISEVFSAIGKSEGFKEVGKTAKEFVQVLREAGPVFAQNFAIGTSIVIALMNNLTKVFNQQTNLQTSFFTKGFFPTLKEGFDQFLADVGSGFTYLLEKLLTLNQKVNVSFSKSAIGKVLGFKQSDEEAKLRTQLLKEDRAKSAYYKQINKPDTALYKATVGTGEQLNPAKVVYDAFNMFDEYYNRIKTKFDIMPPNLLPGGVPPSEDAKAAVDDDKKKKEKQLKALQEIANNTKKANDLTLRDLTYGGGQLAAQGLSRVEQSSARQVSSPQLNASNDIVRGVEKMIRMYSNSNNLNFSFRRS